LTLDTGATTVSLPDDFQAFDGRISLASSGNFAQPWKIEWRNDGEIQQMYAFNPTLQGPPMYAATSVLKGTTGTQGQRFQLLVFPAADQTYTLVSTYVVNPDFMTAANPYHYGGPAHSETVLESCLAVLEERLDDVGDVHRSAF